MIIERPFTSNETRMMRKLINILMIHAPRVKTKSVYIPIDDMEFYWEDLKGNKKIHHPFWLSKKVVLMGPEEGTDICEHLIRIAPYLARHLYEQMDYKQHHITHVLNHLVYNDRLGDQRDNYHKVLKFYRCLLGAYREIPELIKLLQNGEQHRFYEERKRLTVKYGRGLELAMEIYQSLSAYDE